MFTLLRIVSSTTVSELYFYLCAYNSFSHGYSATLAAKLIIKHDFTWDGTILLYSTAVIKITSFSVDRLYKSSAVAGMGDRLATIGMSRKWGGAAVEGWVPI